MSQKINYVAPHMGESRRRPSLFAAGSLFAIAALGLTFLPGITFLLQRIFPRVDRAFFSELSEVLFYGIFMVLPLTVYMYPREGMYDVLRLNALAPRVGIICALAGVAGMLFTNFVSSLWLLLIEALGGWLPANDTLIPTTTLGLCVSIIFSAILPGFCEEVFFRGVFLRAWERFGSRKAVLVSAIWFTLLHASIGGIPAEFINGLILACIVISTNSLLAGILYHTVYNSATLIAAYISNFRVSTEPEIYPSFYASIGGAAGLIRILLLIEITGLFLFALLYTLRKIRQKEGRTEFAAMPTQHYNWSWPELTVFCSGGAVMASWYVYNLLQIAGVLP